MKKLIVVALSLLFTTAALADRTVEVTLIEHLPDEARGWCIDAAGHQVNAIMAGGVHGHTCYSYEDKGIAVDQGFSEDGIAEGYFRLVEFDHCLTMSIDKPDSWISLTPCDGRKTQQFEMTDDGRIISQANPDFCITLGTDVVFGGGGNPLHIIRTSTLDTCSEEKAVLQKWRLRDHKDW